MTDSAQKLYEGHRILEAMHGAVRYGEAVFSAAYATMPSGATKILDFGAGDGFFVERFRAKNIPVDCVEPDPQLQALLRPMVGAIYPDISEAPTASFDFVYTINVLEHIADIERICAELHRVIRPDGKMFVFVPAFEILWTDLDEEVGHVRRFSRASLQSVLKSAGFTVGDIRYFDSLGFAAALGVRILEKFNLFRYESGSIRFYDQYLFPISRQLDHLLHGVIGKNLIAVASRPSSTHLKSK